MTVLATDLNFLIKPAAKYQVRKKFLHQSYFSKRPNQGTLGSSSNLFHPITEVRGPKYCSSGKQAKFVRALFVQIKIARAVNKPHFLTFEEP